ncbi:lasso peptide biosynthesis PqqD family chaperone [Celerinatantimonas yamalensis]|uniref:Lasso peptide biosynthesis PqqD family chaperone n=1 Tax=Celerinatantimonas yamalensis TaxID=559956 RepID=A0ABW9G7E0_9GAMM
MAMTDLTLDTCLQRNPEQIFTKMDGETVMMDLESGNYYGIGGAGNQIWQLLAEPIRIRGLVVKLCDEYEIAHAQCQHDVIAFCQSLINNNLVIKSADPSVS